MSKKKIRLTPAEYAKMEYKEYEHRLSDEDKGWIRQFYEEYYADLVSKVEEDDRVLNTGELVKEARRNHNNLKSDVFEVMGKRGTLHSTEEENVEEFMTDASKEWEWRDAYAIGGEELAYKTIMYQTRQELLDEKDDNEGWMVILARYYVKMDELRKYIKRQKNKRFR